MMRCLTVFFILLKTSLFSQENNNDKLDSLIEQYNQSLEQDSCELSLSIINQMILLVPDHAPYLKAKLYWVRNSDCRNTDSAYNCLTALIKMDSSKAIYYYDRGMLYYDLGGQENFKKATFEFEQTIKVDSFYFPAWERITTYYFYHDAPKAAKLRKEMKKKMEELVYRDSTIAESWYYLGKAWEISVNASKAKISDAKIFECYENAINRDSSIGKYYWERGLMYYKFKEYDKCIIDMRRTNRDNHSTIFITYITLCYEKKGDLDQAMKEVENGLIIFPDHFQLVRVKKDLDKKIKSKK